MKTLKSSLSLLISVMLICSIVPFAVFTASATVTTNPFTADGGDGKTKKNPFSTRVYPILGNLGKSAKNPFLLGNVEDLNKLANIVNGTAGDYSDAFDCKGYFFKLSDTFNNSFSGKEFTQGIGVAEDEANYKAPFQGTFNGNFKSVKLGINNTVKSTLDCGLFGYIGIYGTVKNVITYGSASSVAPNFGGICGLNKGRIINCSNKATITGTSFVGGICGTNHGKVYNCTNSGPITGSGQFIGGVVGVNKPDVTDITNSIINHCVNSGTVTCNRTSYNYVGGICGGNTNKKATTHTFYSYIINCINRGNVIGHSSLCGGVSGVNYYDGFILNCINSGNVNSEGHIQVGGIVGRCGREIEYGCTLKNCINIGSLTGSKCGGICANNDGINNYVKIENCYYDNDICSGITAIYNVTDEGTVRGLTMTQCKATPGKILASGVSINGKISPLIDLLNAYVYQYNKQYAPIYTDILPSGIPTIDALPDGIKLDKWHIYNVYNNINKGYPTLSVNKVNVNLSVNTPKIGNMLPNVKSISTTENVAAMIIDTSWFNRINRKVTKAQLGGTYTVQIRFKLTPETSVEDGTIVTTRINGKKVKAFKDANGIYTARYTFKPLGIANLLSSMCERLFRFNCSSIGRRRR